VRALRAARLALHLARGLAVAGLVFPFLDPEARLRRVRDWSHALLAILSIRLRVHGERPPRRPLLIVANHVSWVDIFALDAVAPVRFVAKSEIRAWPAIGWLAGKAGTLFIRRGHHGHAGRLSRVVAERLIAGERFAVFPEGTTTPGDVLLPFHASLIQPAVLAGVPVVPVAIRYTRTDGSLCREAAYDGDRSLLLTLRQMWTLAEIRVDLSFGDPLIPASGRDRRVLAREAEAAIAALLSLPVPRSSPGRSVYPPDGSR